MTGRPGAFELPLDCGLSKFSGITGSGFRAAVPAQKGSRVFRVRVEVLGYN